MILALKDIRRQPRRFVVTGIGLGLLFTVVLAMTGIYRGMVEEATVLVDRLDADLWVVQRGTAGPFAERSYVPSTTTSRVAVVDGVKSARSFVSYTIQRERPEGLLRMTAVGLDWPRDDGTWLPLVSGHALRQAHWEMVADRSLGLSVGERIPLGSNIFVVVGIVQGLVSSSGDGLAFFAVPDAQAIVDDLPGEAIRLDRYARGQRIRQRLPRLPQLAASADAGAELPGISPAVLNATLVSLQPNASAERVQAAIAKWGDVGVYTREEQRALLLGGVIDKTRKQIKLFRGILAMVSAIVLSLVLYTMTTAKSRELALLKLMGAPQRRIAFLVLHEAYTLALIAYTVAFAVAKLAFPHFPRRVIVSTPEFLGLAIFALFMSTMASQAGLRYARRIAPTSVLSG